MYPCSVFDSVVRCVDITFIWQWCSYQRISYRQFWLLIRDVPRHASYSIYLSHLVRLARCCNSAFVSILKNLQIPSKLMTKDTERFEKHKESFSDHTFSLSRKFVKYRSIRICEAFTFLMENIYVQFDGMVYQQIVGIQIGTSCAPLIAHLFGPRHRRCGSPIVITLSVRLSVRLSVCLSVCLSVRLFTLRCNTITRTVFDLQTSYFIHRWRIKKGRHLWILGSKVKVIVTCPTAGPSLTVSVF